MKATKRICDMIPYITGQSRSEYNRSEYNRSVSANEQKRLGGFVLLFNEHEETFCVTDYWGKKKIGV